MTSGKIDDPIDARKVLDGKIDSLLTSLEALATDDGKSIEEMEAEAMATEKQREEERRATYERLGLIDRGFPRRALDCLDEVTGEPWKKALRDAYRTVLTPGSIIVLNGRYGTGKTVLSTFLGRVMYRRKKRVLYSKAYDYTMALRETFNGNGSESAVMARYKAPYLLVLDEYHEVKDTEFTGPALERLIDYRHQNGKPTILSPTTTLQPWKIVLDQPLFPASTFAASSSPATGTPTGRSITGGKPNNEGGNGTGGVKDKRLYPP